MWESRPWRPRQGHAEDPDRKIKRQGASNVASPLLSKVTCSETDLLTSSIRLRGVSSLAPNKSVGSLFSFQREAGAMKGVPRCIAAYPPNEILKISGKKQENCYMTCDDRTLGHSGGIIRWIAKLEGSLQGWPTP